MPIDIASYRAWEGRARPAPLAALGIAATTIRRRLRIRIVRIIVFVFLVVSTGAAALVFYGTLTGRGDPRVQEQIRRFGFENVDVLAILNRLFDIAIGFWAFVLAALVGAPVIAEDRRARALPLYFSRPIGHIDYVLGKAMSAAFFLALLLIVPRIAMYGMDIAFADAKGAAWDHMPTFLRSCAVGALGVALFTSLSLGVSSLFERPAYAALFLLGLGALLSVTSLFLADVLESPGWLALSPYACVHRIAIDLLPVPIGLSDDTAALEKLGIGTAWTGYAAWTALGLFVLTLRVRRVEVVT
ncbi:MAG TPA: ABC transporter permease subunit [Planctomycetota bacterium]|nr:ABC transporter permease subunit [Planctomycetota bacterium]